MDKVFEMATIATVGRFKIGMFPSLSSHHAPYFKVFLGDGSEKSASILIEDLSIKYIKGISKNELKEVLAWALENKEDLLKNLELVKNKKSPNKIKSSAPPALLKIEAMSNLILKATFENQQTRYVDFKKIDMFGLFAPLKKQEYFEKVELKEGFPTWPNGLDLDPDEIWLIGTEVSEVAATTS